MALDDVDKNLYVIGDRMRIMQVLMNLLSNAAKFTPSGEIHFGYQLRGNVVQFYVKDTGIGIPANRVAKIFERFGKINNFCARDRTGTDCFPYAGGTDGVDVFGYVQEKE